MPGRISPSLWFDREALPAAEFYCGVFPDSRITHVAHYPDNSHDRQGEVLTVAFELDGQAFVAINGGPQFPFTEAVSFVVSCIDQDDVDRYWDLLVDGGQPGQCGWLKDRFGLSWQIVPARLGEVLGSAGSAEAAQRLMAEFYTMSKIDLPRLEAIAAGG